MDEEIKQPVVEASDQPVERPLSLVDEAKAIRDEIIKSKEELKTENDRKEKINADALLSGTGGAPAEIPQPKEETPKEYADRVMTGKA